MAEKSTNDLPRDLRVLFTKGHEALQRDNFDYAIDLLNQVLSREPAVFEARKELRTAQLHKASKGSGLFKKFLSSASATPLVGKAQVALRRNPAEALSIAEHILNNDPMNSAGHRIIVEAAEALELPRTAALSLELLFKNAPKDKDVAIKLANALALVGDVQRGERILAELLRTLPGDNDVAQALKDLSARKTLNEGGYEALADGTGSYRDILKDKDHSVRLEQENRQVKAQDSTTELIKDWETRLQADPNNLKLLRNLGETFVQRNDFDRALGYFDRMTAVDGGNDAAL